MTTHHTTDRTFVVWVEVPVEITVNDPTVLDRPLNDPDWHRHYWTPDGHESVLKHLAYNALVNGRSNGEQLDGWADLDEDAVTMSLDLSSLSYVDVLGGTWP